MIPSLEGWPTKAKEAPSPHEVRLTPLDTNPVFQYLILFLQLISIKQTKTSINNIIYYKHKQLSFSQIATSHKMVVA